MNTSCLTIEPLNIERNNAALLTDVLLKIDLLTIEHASQASHTDHLGSTGYMTDEAGNIREHIEYTPWGETWMERENEDMLDGVKIIMPNYMFTSKELDASGLYYFGARYYDPQTSLWQSKDQALNAYLPTVGKDDEKLPGMGGVYNSSNINLYIYSHNNPLNLVDPDGNMVTLKFYVQKIVPTGAGGQTAIGFIVGRNDDTGQSFIVKDVRSGGIGDKESNNAPFGKYNILDRVKGHDGSDLSSYNRLEAVDGNYGDDEANFPGQPDGYTIRIHPKGSGSTFGCVSMYDEKGSNKFAKELNVTSKGVSFVKNKSMNPFVKGILPWEPQTKFGTLEIIDATKDKDRTVKKK
jgi:RHS repeat-associated protein